MSNMVVDSKGSGFGLKSLKGLLAATAGVAALVSAATVVSAQESMEVVTVTGYRASLESALNTKRASAEMVDAINAEDIAAFPDANLAESLQRLPGVSIDRDNGEGRTITVRGLNADFTRVTLNGMEALSTAGASASGDDPNRSRAFDFNTFASELFSGLKVYKSPAAETDEGSLGATVELQTGRPFDTGNKVVLSLQNGTYEYGAGFNPRIASVVSHTFLGGRLGVLGSVAYNMRQQKTDSYQNSPSVSSLLYRSSVFKTSAATERYGFADAYSTSDTSNCNVSTATGTVPLTKVAYSPYCTAMQGSSSSAYSTLEGTGTAAKGGQAYATIIPTSATLNHRVLYQSRLGLTGSIQWQADDNTLITFDGVFSSTYQNSTNYQLSAIGLNRNNTSSNMLKLSSTLTNSKDAGYLQSAFGDAGKCVSITAAQAATYGIAQVGCLDSYAYNADPYAYYTNNGTNLANGAAAVISFMGKPSTKVASVHVMTPAGGSTTAAMLSTGATGSGVVDQMTLANVDLASRADQAFYTTQFEQGTLAASHTFSDKFRIDASLGMSVSRNHQVGYLVEFNKMDSGSYDSTSGTCTGCYVYDATAEDEDMPYIDYGFDVRDSTKWNVVKDYSNYKHYMTNTINKFRSLKFAAAYDLNDMVTLKAGFSGRIYDFDTTKYARVYKDNYGLPAISELKAKYGSSFSVADLGKTVSWGTGLSTPSGMSVGGWFAPDINKFKKYIINDSADFGPIDTMSNQFSTASTSVAGNTYDVHEHDKSGYGQIDFKEVTILGRELRGNIGVRVATTSVESHGHGTVGNDLYASNYYANVLPSANLAYSLTDDMLIRASVGKVIARPQLAAMAPSITSFSISTSSCSSETACGAGSSSLTIGNTKLKPYSANTVDIGYEWYFDQGAVFSVGAFAKYIKDMPQQVTTSGYLSDFMDNASYSQLYSIYNDPALGMGKVDTTTGENLYADIIKCSYNKTSGCQFAVTTYANAKGGVLDGIEINYQQVFKFLPSPFDGLGVNFNYTLLHSKMSYILAMPTASNPAGQTGYGPWVGASPNAFNATLFYDGKDWQDRSWSGRVSFAYRSKYASAYPIASGSSNTGSNVDDSSPIMNDFVYTKSTLNVDASFTYDLAEFVQFKIDALNLTNQSSNKYAYAGSPVASYYDSTGRQIFVGVRFKY